MARWKLLEPHYIFGIRDGSSAEWEYKEMNRANGREIRKKYRVPFHLDPKIETDWTHRAGPFEDGMIVVALAGTTDPKDIIIERESVGPGMDPIDDEAKAISKELEKTLPRLDGHEDSTYSERLLDRFMTQLEDARVDAATVAAAVPPGIQSLLESLVEMQAQNTKILAMLANDKANPMRKI